MRTRKEKIYIAKLIKYAKAPRVSAQKYSRFENGNFVDYWSARLLGKNITLGEPPIKTKIEALEVARKFRQNCIDRCKELNINLIRPL